jgi:AraC-like DNA-binding protein
MANCPEAQRKQSKFYMRTYNYCRQYTMTSSTVYDALARSILTQQVETAFFEATGLPVELIPSDDSFQFFSLQEKQNPFCRLMSQSMGSCAACQKAHRELQRRTEDSLVPQTLACFAGLAEFAVPIVVNGEYVATLRGGQVFARKPTPAQFDQLAEHLHTWGLSSEVDRLRTRFFQTQVMARKRFQASVQMLALFAKLLAEDVNRSLLAGQVHDEPLITTARNFILAHASERLRLRDVAEHIHVSTHYFCKFFKKATGMGFSEFLGRARVENAKLALANSLLPIGEVANQTGFGSLSQFNRTFYRYAGCSPKEYRASQRQVSSL